MSTLAELVPTLAPYLADWRTIDKPGLRYPLSDEQAHTLYAMRLHLSTFVPFAIQDVIEKATATGFPLEMYHKAAQWGWELVAEDERVDPADVLYIGRATGELMAALTKVVAVLAFAPGGVSALGLHFEATYPV